MVVVLLSSLLVSRVERYLKLGAFIDERKDLSKSSRQFMIKVQCVLGRKGKEKRPVVKPKIIYSKYLFCWSRMRRAIGRLPCMRTD